MEFKQWLLQEVRYITPLRDLRFVPGASYGFYREPPSVLNRASSGLVGGIGRAVQDEFSKSGYWNIQTQPNLWEPRQRNQQYNAEIIYPALPGDKKGEIALQNAKDQVYNHPRVAQMVKDKEIDRGKILFTKKFLPKTLDDPAQWVITITLSS